MDDLLRSLLDLFGDMIGSLIRDPGKVIEWPINLVIPSGILIAIFVAGIFLQATGHNLLGTFFVEVSTFIGDLTTKIGLALLNIAVYLFLVLILFKISYFIVKDLIRALF